MERKIVNNISALFFPIVYIPYRLLSKNNWNKTNDFSLPIAFGLLSAYYIPDPSNDKFKYIEFYDSVKGEGIRQFLTNVYENFSDALMYSFISIIANSNLSFSIAAFAITAVTIFGLQYVAHKLSNGISSRLKSTFFLSIFLSLSLHHLFSGMRFYLGMSFFLVSLTYQAQGGNFLRQVTFYVISVITHYSFILFSPILFMHNGKIRNVKKLYYNLLIVSLILSLLNVDIVYLIAEYFNINIGFSGIDSKLKAYLYSNQDIISTGITEGNLNYVIAKYSNRLWFYFAVAYLLLKRDLPLTLQRKIVIYSLVLINVFNGNMFIQERLMLASVIMFIYVLFSESTRYTSILKGFTLVMVLSFLIDIVALRDILKVSYGNIDSFFTFMSLVKI